MNNFAFFDDVETFTDEELQAMGRRSLEEGLPLTSEVSSAYRQHVQLLLNLTDETNRNPKGNSEETGT